MLIYVKNKSIATTSEGFTSRYEGFLTPYLLLLASYSFLSFVLISPFRFKKQRDLTYE